jgi:flagellar FliJ protein
VKRFNFPLQKILDLRQFREDEARMALGRAVGEGERIKHDLETTAQMRVQAMGDIRDATAEGVMVDPMALMALQNYIRRLDQQKERLLVELAQAELVIAEKRAAFAETMKARKVFTNLQDKQFAQWRKDTRRQEDAVLDEIKHVT